MPSSCYTRYAGCISEVSSCGITLLQACEKQEKCRDAARDLLNGLDDFLRFGFEKLEPELKERRETRKIVGEIARLITEISVYIIKNNRNMFKTFFRMSANPSLLEIVFIGHR